MEWVAALLPAIASVVMMVLKGLFGTDEPQKTSIKTATPEVEVSDGKTDAERLTDLGL